LPVAKRGKRRIGVYKSGYRALVSCCWSGTISGSVVFVNHLAGNASFTDALFINKRFVWVGNRINM